MFFDLDLDSRLNDLALDVLVVGAGAVGLTLAIKLARKGVNVTVIESGGMGFEKKSQDLNLFTLTGHHHDGISEGRARIVGGTTTLWGGQLVPFSEIDFMIREWVPESGWPINKQDLDSYYNETANLLGLNNDYSCDSSVWASLKEIPPDLEDDFHVFLTRWLKETNFHKLFYKEMKGRDNLTLITHGVVTGLSSSEGTGCIDRVLVSNTVGDSFIFEAKKVILACGTIEASRLMLYSASQNHDLPWFENKWVGALFQDHLDIRAAKVIPIDEHSFHQAFDNIFIAGYKFQPKIKISDDFQKKHKSLNIASSFAFDSSVAEQMANFKIFARSLLRGSIPENWYEFPKHLLTIFSIFTPIAVRYIKDRRILSLSDKGIYLILHCEQVPMVNSKISLDWTKLDLLGMPAVDLDWQIDSREIKSMSEFCKNLNVRLQNAGLASLDIEQALLDFDTSILEKCHDSNHQCGGLRMALSKESGVVDKNLKVFGTSNMYVAGASVFPTSSHANSTFTAMALGLRLVDTLLELEG